MEESPVLPALARVAERFSSKLPAKLAAIEAVARSLSTESDPSDLAEVERILHDIAGTGPLLGHSRLGVAAREAETAVVEFRDVPDKRSPQEIDRLKAMLLGLRQPPAP